MIVALQNDPHIPSAVEGIKRDHLPKCWCDKAEDPSRITDLHWNTRFLIWLVELTPANGQISFRDSHAGNSQDDVPQQHACPIFGNDSVAFRGGDPVMKIQIDVGEGNRCFLPR